MCYRSVMSQAHSRERTVAPPLYERDLYAWVQEQVKLLRAGRLDEIDAENIAEEISDVGSNEYDKLESALRVLLAHMLKWDHQPEKRTRSWENTIAEQRRRVRRQLRRNLSLKSEVDEAVGEGFASARLLASTETGFEVDRFPESCPYDWEMILDRPYKR